MNIIAHNVLAMNAQRMHGINTDQKKKSAERLSSGYKINRAADDAAGLSISEKMRKQIRGLMQGSENIQDGISLCQTTDGAMEEITECLQRMHELSIKAYNGTNSQSDRNDIQSEISEIRDEIKRIADSTKFNEIYVLKGDPTHTGQIQGPSQSISWVEIEESRSVPAWLKVDSKLSLHNTAGDESVAAIATDAIQNIEGYMISDKDADGNENAVYYGPAEASHVSVNGIKENTDGYEYMGGWTSQMDNNRYASIDFSGLAAASSTGEELYDNLIDLIGTGVGVGCSTNCHRYYGVTFLGSEPELKIESTGDIKLQADGVLSNAASTTINLSEWDIFDDGRNVFKVVADLIHDQYNDDTLSDEDKKMQVSELSGRIAHAIRDKVWDDLYERTSALGHYNMVLPKDSSNEYALTIYDYRDVEDMYNAHDADVLTETRIKGEVGYIQDIGPVYGPIKSRLEIQAGADNLESNRIPIDLPFIDNERMGISDYSVARYTTTTTYSDEYLKKLAVWENDIEEKTVHHEASSIKVPKIETVTKWVDGEKVVSSSWDGTYSIVNVPASDEIIYVHKSPKPEPGPGDVYETTIYDPDDFIIISDALKYVTNWRSVIGAQQNRLEHAFKVNTNTAENTQAAESLIRDTDMADEMVRYSKHNILEQAGVSVMSQANQSNQGVLSLLG